jgi:23S rRNA G2069 N7-methylase RlmK/C1962 C5-methylase RlmI
VTPDDVARHAEMFANRVRKNHRKLAKGFERENVGAFRLYDWDIPEVRAVADWVEGHLVVAEYVRAQTAHLEDYAGALARAAGEALGVPEAHLHVRERRTRPDRGARYGRLGRGGTVLEVRERALRFWVNLDDYLDIGLFADHRDTRRMVGERSADAAVLNLFGYTGSFTCWAAHGGARATVTVDASRRYADWARDNLALNRLEDPRHEIVAADVASFLERERRAFDLVVVDPPSFSTRYGRRDFDVVRDHPALLARVRERVAPGGTVLFSTNHQRFEPRLEGLPYAAVEEITARTVPRDYRNRTIHRAFLLRARGGPVLR